MLISDTKRSSCVTSGNSHNDLRGKHLFTDEETEAQSSHATMAAELGGTEGGLEPRQAPDPLLSPRYQPSSQARCPCHISLSYSRGREQALASRNFQSKRLQYDVSHRPGQLLMCSQPKQTKGPSLQVIALQHTVPPGSLMWAPARLTVPRSIASVCAERNPPLTEHILDASLRAT